MSLKYKQIKHLVPKGWRRVRLGETINNTEYIEIIILRDGHKYFHKKEYLNYSWTRNALSACVYIPKIKENT